MPKNRAADSNMQVFTSLPWFVLCFLLSIVSFLVVLLGTMFCKASSGCRLECLLEWDYGCWFFFFYIWMVYSGGRGMLPYFFAYWAVNEPFQDAACIYVMRLLLLFSYLRCMEPGVRVVFVQGSILFNTLLFFFFLIF